MPKMKLVESNNPKDISFYATKDANLGPYKEMTSDVNPLLNKMFKIWNVNPHSDADLDDKLKMEVTELAKRFVTKYKKISGNIILGMIMMLGR